jgi:hypothetical protein
MTEDQAELLKASLESVMHCLEVPMLLGTAIGDPVLKRAIGPLSGDVISRIDYEIFPLLYQQFPQLRDKAT